jgi:hypothetical protein
MANAERESLTIRDDEHSIELQIDVASWKFPVFYALLKLQMSIKNREVVAITEEGVGRVLLGAKSRDVLKKTAFFGGISEDEFVRDMAAYANLTADQIVIREQKT